MRRLGPALPFVLAVLLLPGGGADAATGSTLTRLVPQPDGKANFGFTYRLFDSSAAIDGDTRPFDERMRDSIEHELGGKTPTFLKVWTPWQRPDQRGKPFVPFSDAAADIARVRGVVGGKGLLHLDWNLTLSSGANEGLTVRDIARGTADSYIRTYARDVREYGEPILMTLFNGEFNGSWWYAVSPLANPSLTTQDFVRAWRRVVDIYRAVGATNVSWGWVVNSYPAEAGEQPGIDRDIASYYPGDAYVDWVGIDVYDVGAPSWMDGPYAFAATHGKPVFIGEFGIRHEWSSLLPSQWGPWLSSVFDYFESHPAIKAISYFDYCNRSGATHVTWDPSRSVYLDGGRVNYVPDLNDHDHRLLAGGPAIQALYASRISSPRYVSAISTEPVESMPAGATAQLLAPLIRGRRVTARWIGNLAAHTFDLTVRGKSSGWRTVVARTPANAARLTGSPGERVLVRVRPWNVDGVAGPWSPARSLVLPG